MQELISAVTQIGILPVIILFLLWDYSKKMALLQIEVAKNTVKIDTVLMTIERIEDKL